MVDYVKIIADKINTGIPVALYTVGGDTFSVVRALKRRYGVKPVAVCDRDTAKQGRAYRGLDEIPVMSFEDTNSSYPNAEYFISSMDYRYDIMGELVHGGDLPPERIINWEPVEKRISCKFWEKLVCAKHDGTLSYCWEVGSPQIPIIDGIDSAVSEVISLRDDLISGAKGLNELCDKCGYVTPSWYPISKKSWWINYFGQGKCNYKCKYCSSPVHETVNTDAGDDSPPLKDVIDALSKAGMLSDFYSIILSTSGEPSLHPQRKSFYDAFDGYSLVVNTNGSVYDEDLFSLMQTKMVRLIVSIDAGHRETFKTIKGVDCIYKVIENMCKYQQSAIGMVVPKYVVTPGINDDETNIDAFCEICRELNVPYAIAAYDMFSARPIPDRSTDMLMRLESNLENMGILCAPYTECYTHEYCTTLGEVFSPKNDKES